MGIFSPLEFLDSTFGVKGRRGRLLLSFVRLVLLYIIHQLSRGEFEAKRGRGANCGMSHFLPEAGRRNDGGTQ